MDDVQCPYCGANQEIDHDDGYGYEEDEVYIQECGKCEKTFTYATSIYFHYKVAQAPCQNGGKHKWVLMTGCPKEHFKNKQRCAFCDNRRTVAI